MARHGARALWPISTRRDDCSLNTRRVLSDGVRARVESTKNVATKALARNAVPNEPRCTGELTTCAVRRSRRPPLHERRGREAPPPPPSFCTHSHLRFELSVIYIYSSPMGVAALLIIPTCMYTVHVYYTCMSVCTRVLTCTLSRLCYRYTFVSTSRLTSAGCMVLFYTYPCATATLSLSLSLSLPLYTR